MALLTPLLLSLLLSAAFGLQRAERHFGCAPGKNACIYPLTGGSFHHDVLFDFQVALHVPPATPIDPDFRSAISIHIKLPSGAVLTPESAFAISAQPRNWTFFAFDSAADIMPDPFASYALTYRNVCFTSHHGVGPVSVTVHARDVTTVARYTIRPPVKRRARNVVLFVGDGMALPMMAAARLVSRGIAHGRYNSLLHMEQLPFHALQHPPGVDSIIPDSANSASAFHTGHKTSVGALGVVADSSPDDLAHPKVETIAEHVKRRYGMAVGVVTTAALYDATPAAVWAHVRRRVQAQDILNQAINACEGCQAAVQPDVLMGGGGDLFLPSNATGGVDVYAQYAAKGYTVTHTREEMLKAAANNNTDKLLTVSHRGDMNVWLDRNVFKENLQSPDDSPRGDGVPPTDQPGLNDMVTSALKVLSRNKNGFFLMIEASGIDNAAHALDVPRTLSDLLELDNVVGNVARWARANGDETLLLATADHGHGFDVFGTVDTALWDILVNATDEESVSDVEHMCRPVSDLSGRLFRAKRDKTTGMRGREANRARRLSVGVFDGAGFPDYVDADGDGFPDSWNVRTVLASGMNNYPDHTEDYRVSPQQKVPAVLVGLPPGTDLSEAGGSGIRGLPTDLESLLKIGAVNNPRDDPNGIFLTGNLSPFVPVDVHTMQDVGLFAGGPGAERVRGFMDSTEVFHVIADALGFGTDGRLDEEQHLFGDVVRCVNERQRCHCDEVDRAFFCACRHRGPESFVRPGTRMCSVMKGVVRPM